LGGHPKIGLAIPEVVSFRVKSNYDFLVIGSKLLKKPYNNLFH